MSGPIKITINQLINNYREIDIAKTVYFFFFFTFKYHFYRGKVKIILVKIGKQIKYKIYST